MKSGDVPFMKRGDELQPLQVMLETCSYWRACRRLLFLSRILHHHHHLPVTIHKLHSLLKRAVLQSTMQQQRDYTSDPYYQIPHIQNPNHYASAPLFTPSDYTTSSSQNPHPTPPSPYAPSHSFNSYQPPLNHQPYYPHFDHNPNYDPSNISATYTHTASTYEHPGDAYFGYLHFDQNDVGYKSRYEPVHDAGYGDDDGVYAYEGGKMEPYGARGTATKFDDYGRSISFSSHAESSVSVESNKVVKAVPKGDAQQGVENVVQKFRVKLLPESGGQSTLDVLCKIGLDGICMLDPNTSRTLRIYPLENITRCDRLDSSTFAFWSMSPVDIEPRRIRLQSNSYTTNTLLDTVTAATVQFKEMYESRRPAESLKTNEKSTEKKKGFGDWVNLIKPPPNEEKDHWVPDEAVSKCTACGIDFGAFIRKHHCRNCGDIFCDKCTQGRIALTADENAQPVRVCDRCMAEVTQRLSSAQESSSKPVLQCHEDLARKLQEELEKNLKISGFKSDA